MKKIYLIWLCCCLSSSWILAQTTIQLHIEHQFDKTSFVAAQTYLTDNGQAVQINSVQYYLSNLELLHDGGQLLDFSSQYLLVDSKQTDYELGNTMVSIAALENITFDLGVDTNTNQTRPSDYAATHALANTNMYAADDNSYVLIAIRGLVDSDGDEVPDLPFEIAVTGNQLQEKVSLETELTTTTDILHINLTANISKWLTGVDLVNLTTQQNQAADWLTLMENTTTYGVFSSTATTSVTTLVSPKNHIHVDARLQYAATIYYKFYTGEQLDMTITNITGTYMVHKSQLSPEGNFYLEDNLAAGIYIVIFTSPKGIRQSKRFIISQ